MHLHKLGSRGEDGLIKSFLTVEWFKLACNVGVLLHTPGITHLASAAHGGTWESGPHKSHQSPLPMINSLLEGIVFSKTTSLPAQAPSNVCLEPEDCSEVLMLVWASLCRSSGATAIHCMSANLMFPHNTPAFSIPVGTGQVQPRFVPQVLCTQCYKQENDDGQPM